MPSREYLSLRLSHDGSRVALDIRDESTNGVDVWTYDVGRHVFTRLTFGGRSSMPIWTPDGVRVVYRSEEGGPYNLFWRAADGTGEQERLTTSEHVQFPTAVSPDGRRLAFMQMHPEARTDLWALSLDGDRRPTPLLATQATEAGGTFSPDGRWLAYASDESGQFQIYVRSAQDAGGKWQVSSSGGIGPIWARDGKELFFRDRDRIMVARVTTRTMFSIESVSQIFQGPISQRQGPNFDVSLDGRRLLVLMEAGSPGASHINVVLNWQEALKRRVPTK
jgi:Tol biopolymer transport system component